MQFILLYPRINRVKWEPMKIIVDYLQSSNYCDWMNTVSRQEMEDVFMLIQYFGVKVNR